MGIDKNIKFLFDILFTGKEKIFKGKFLSVFFIWFWRCCCLIYFNKMELATVEDIEKRCLESMNP